MRRRALFFAVSFIVCCLLSSCVKTASYESPIRETGQEAAQKNTQHYVAIYSMSSYDYFTDHIIGFLKAGEDLQVNAEEIGPDENDIEAMKECFMYAIAKNVNGIVVFGANPELKELIDMASEAGIPVVTVDGDVKDSKRIAFVGSSNSNVGILGGKLIAEELQYSGEVGILTELDVDLHQERAQGYEKAIEQYPQMQVVAKLDTYNKPESAYASALKMIQEHPGLRGIVCTDYFGGAAAALAVENTGNQGKIKIIAMDKSGIVLKKIDEGVISASLVQQTALMSYYALQILYDYNNPPVQIVGDNKEAKISGVPVYVDTGIFVIDRSNCKEFF